MKTGKIVLQAGVVALCDGEVCLVTNTSGRNWTVPKGHVEPKMTSRESALLECFEEAGLTGVAAEEPLGTYAYVKNGQSHLVTVYVLHVSEILTDWPEARRRHRTFLAPDLASAKVDNEGLRLLIARASSHAVKDWPSEVRRLARLRVVGPRP